MSGSWCPSHLCSWGPSSLIVAFCHVFWHQTCSLLTNYIPMEKQSYWITWYAQDSHLISHMTITNSISYICSCLFDSVFLWYINRRVYTLYPTTHLFPCPWLEHRPGSRSILGCHETMWNNKTEVASNTRLSLFCYEHKGNNISFI